MSREVQVSIAKESFKTEIKIDQHLILADEPTELGGADLGPTPTELLLASLGSCKAITVKMYADRKQWDLQGIDIKLTIDQQKDGAQRKTLITCSLDLKGELSEEQKERLKRMAEKCPIHLLLSNPIVIESNLL